MELSVKSLTLFITVLLTGLSAGFFYAWLVSVIPGTRKIADANYLETMQMINRAILNPAFYLIFMGPPLLLAISAFQQFNAGAAFWILLLAFLTYLAGTFGVTAFGNVPLNDTLDALDLSGLGADEISRFRGAYEEKWNQLHWIRTGFSLIAFGLSIGGIFLQIKP